MKRSTALIACFFLVSLLLCLLAFFEIVDIDSAFSMDVIARIVPAKVLLSNIDIDFNSHFLTNFTIDRGTGVVPVCVPYNEFMTEKAKETLKKEKTWNKSSPIVILAAYEYEEHMSITFQNDGLYGTQVYCHFLDQNFLTIDVPSPGYVYPRYVTSCCKREGAAFVSLTQFHYDTPVHFVPIIKRPKKPVYDLSVCLCPIYGNTSVWLMLTELVEHYRLQGVDHFYVYVWDMDEYSRKLLHSYAASGDIETIFLSDHVQRKGRDWQIMAINDCLARSRQHSRLILSQDIDERITPLGNVTLREYVESYFRKNPKVGILNFRMRWILRNEVPPLIYQGNKTLIDHLPTLNYHNTSAPAPEHHTSKNVLDPMKVLVMWVHYATTMYPGYMGKGSPPQEVEIRHYRDVILSD